MGVLITNMPITNITGLYVVLIGHSLGALFFLRTLCRTHRAFMGALVFFKDFMSYSKGIV